MHSSWKNNRARACFCIILLGIFTNPGNAESKNTPPTKVGIQNGTLLISAHDANLGELLEKISSVCQIHISGLEKREDETVTFVSGNGSIEREMKRLLRYLKVGNYTFEYDEDQLKVITVFPSSNEGSPEHPASSEIQQGTENRQTKVVRVEGILEGSQAEILNLMKGDLVVSYDNIRISNAGQLRTLTKSKPDWEKFDMIVLRNGNPIKLIVNGGQIGIYIKTVQIPSETLKPYHSSY